MGKMKELSTVLDEIVTCGETLVQGAEKLRDMMTTIDGLAECGKALIASSKALREYFSTDEISEKSTPRKATAKKESETETQKTYTKQDVRKILSKASQNGHRSEVIGLLKKYGADNITALNQNDYAAVIAEAEVMTNE